MIGVSGQRFAASRMASTPRSRRKRRAAKSSAAATAAGSWVLTSRPRASFIAPLLVRGGLWCKVAGPAHDRRVPTGGARPHDALGGLATRVDRNRGRRLVAHEYRLQQV